MISLHYSFSKFLQKALGLISNFEKIGFFCAMFLIPDLIAFFEFSGATAKIILENV